MPSPACVASSRAMCLVDRQCVVMVRLHSHVYLLAEKYPTDFKVPAQPVWSRQSGYVIHYSEQHRCEIPDG